VKERARSIFRVIADAEARIHATTPEQVHFHEVGALDSIVDVVGSAICMEECGIEAVYSSAVRLGSGGFIDTQHGRMRSRPATLEILKGYPSVLTSVAHELTTPTGAAIIRALSSGLLDDEASPRELIGYGAGTTNSKRSPISSVSSSALWTRRWSRRSVIVETNIDDMNPQAYPFVIELLLARGRTMRTWSPS